jgi:signal transduction histidine kinase
MKTHDHLRGIWFKAGLGFGIWTLIGLFLTTQALIIIHSANQVSKEEMARISAQGASWAEILLLSLAECYLWAVLALGIFRLARWFPLDRRHWLRSLAVHAGAAVVAAVLETGVSMGIRSLVLQRLGPPAFSFEVVQFFLSAKFHSNVLIYGAILGVSLAVDYYRKYRDRELRAIQLQARLAQTQLQVLKMQLHPHFLFNTLNAISALIHQDVDVADRMIARLGDLLRSTLENANKQEVPLKEELDFIKPYLEIEQARLGPRLAVTWDVDPDTIDAAVPNLILQPLVENAIRHGVAPRPGAARVEIHVRRADGMLHLEVRDDGPGLAANTRASFKEGIGLTNTRARLQQLYGSAHRFELGNGKGHGLCVMVSIPFREMIEGKPPELDGG